MHWRTQSGRWRAARLEGDVAELRKERRRTNADFWSNSVLQDAEVGHGAATVQSEYRVWRVWCVWCVWCVW